MCMHFLDSSVTFVLNNCIFGFSHRFGLLYACRVLPIADINFQDAP